ncbi:MAG: PQQ-binding-like beta-propeller repeat protein [Pirellulaceae bacterium]
MPTKPVIASILVAALIGVALSAPSRSISAAEFAAGDWPWWRGPAHNGVAQANQQPPLEWSETKNVVWKTPVPGRGHASPTIIGDRIFLATADEKLETRSVLALDRATGKPLWKVDVHQGGFDRRGHQKSSQASATVASDGERLFANFLHEGAVFTTALDLDGQQLWQTRVAEFITHQGFGSSPVVHHNLVIVAADNKAGGVIAGLDRRDGHVVWQHARPKQPNYTTPAILTIDSRDQLLLAGCDHITSLDPLTGKPIWEIEGSTTECVGSIVTDGQLVFASGGYPKKLTQAVRADGSGEIVWQNDVQTYVPSMIVHDRHLYTVTDNGIAICWDSSTGKEQWKARLGGTFNASPVLVGQSIFATSQDGTTHIFRANPEKFEPIGENSLGDDVYATPVFSNSQIFMRVAKQDGDKRQEWLYCLGRSTSTDR